jgi:hypothetical protein
MTASTDATAGAGRSSRFDGISPVLFAAYPVLFLWSQNVGETDPSEVVGPLVVVIAVAVGATLVLRLLLRDIRRAALIVSPTILALLMYGHATRLLGGSPIPLRIGQLALAGVLVIAVVAAVRLGPRAIARVDTAMNRISAILVGITLVGIIAGLAPGLTGRPVVRATEPAYAMTTTAPRRDVWYIIFDRYGSDEALRLRYHKVNELTPWLESQGFVVLDDSHANYGRTSLSISSTLNLTHLGGFAARMPPDSRDYTVVQSSIRGSVVGRQFRALGYDYLHVGSWWDATAEDPVADVNHRLGDTTAFASVLFETSALPKLTTRLGLTDRPPSARTRNWEHGRFGFDTLDALVDDPSPKFVFAHILLPHPPVVFDRDGSFLTESKTAGLTGADRWARQFEYTNGRIRRLVEALLALPPDRQPIIVLQGDEGPYPASYQRDLNGFAWADAPPDDLETKFGVLNAWYLPGDEDIGLYPSMTLVNTFPTLFAGYFGLDYERLPDTVWASRGRRQPYQLLDITDRLPSLR